jgi:LytS/YehU family sensor histidine kinase
MAGLKCDFKHGVSASADPVEIALQASHQAGRLRIMVENDVPDDGTETILRQGMGLGLRNVAERLRLRLQGEANVSFGLVTPRRFRVAIDLPWRSA